MLRSRVTVASKECRKAPLLWGLFIAVISAALMADPVESEPLGYHCLFAEETGYNWISPEYVFEIDPSTKTAFNTSGYYEAIPTKVRVNRKKQFRLSWRATLKSTSGQDFTLDYIALIDPNSRSISLRGNFIKPRFPGFAKQVHSIGTCRKLTTK